jgi:hypothetical protein
MTLKGVFADAATQQHVERELTNDEILTTFLPQVALTADKATVKADGSDFVTVNAQLHSVPMSDGKPVNLALVHTVILLIGETEIRLETDSNGRASHELEFSDDGVYSVRVQNLHSNVLEIKAG